MWTLRCNSDHLTLLYLSGPQLPVRQALSRGDDCYLVGLVVFLSNREIMLAEHLARSLEHGSYTASGCYSVIIVITVLLS